MAREYHQNRDANGCRPGDYYHGRGVARDPSWPLEAAQWVELAHEFAGAARAITTSYAASCTSVTPECSRALEVAADRVGPLDDLFARMEALNQSTCFHFRGWIPDNFDLGPDVSRDFIIAERSGEKFPMEASRIIGWLSVVKLNVDVTIDAQWCPRAPARSFAPIGP